MLNKKIDRKVDRIDTSLSWPFSTLQIDRYLNIQIDRLRVDIQIDRYLDVRALQYSLGINIYIDGLWSSRYVYRYIPRSHPFSTPWLIDQLMQSLYIDGLQVVRVYKQIDKQYIDRQIKSRSQIDEQIPHCHGP